jgi:hypothetical protein
MWLATMRVGSNTATHTSQVANVLCFTIFQCIVQLADVASVVLVVVVDVGLLADHWFSGISIERQWRQQELLCCWRW